MTGKPKTIDWPKRYLNSWRRWAAERSKTGTGVSLAGAEGLERAIESARAESAMALMGGVVDLALSEPGRAVAGRVDRLDELADADGGAVEQDGGLPAGEIDLDLMNARIFRKGFLDRGFALMAVHPFDPDHGKLVTGDVGGHELKPPRCPSLRYPTAKDVASAKPDDAHPTAIRTPPIP